MSFVAGFVAGIRTGEVRERRKERGHFLEYMERRGYSVVDQDGQPVPLAAIANEALQENQNSTQTVLMAGAVFVTAVVLTGGSVWAFAAAIA